MFPLLTTRKIDRAGGGKYVIGIDLGTTYSCAAVWKNGRPEVIPNEQGNRVTPSCVSFDGSELLVGDGAKNRSIKNPKNTIFDAKRLIGRRYSDEKVQHDKKYWPFEVVAGENDRPTIKVQFEGKEKHQAPEEISAKVLSNIKKYAETFLGSPVKKAVVTVPAYFNNSQREATKTAATIAELDVIHILNEPTAAALAFGVNNTDHLRGHGERRVLIFDLGGGTFDVSLLKVDEHGVFQVKATAGDTHLGGQDLDNRMVQHCLEVFQRKYNVEISGNARSSRCMARLKKECEEAKRRLSFTPVTDVVVDGFYDGIDLEIRFSRSKFEELNSDLFDKCLGPLKQCLEDAKVGKGSVDEVVLVGGSTRIPRIQEMVREFFNGKDLNLSIHPDEAVAMGAAIQAASLQDDLRGTQKGPGSVLLDIAPLSLGLDDVKGIMNVVVPRNTRIPCEIIQSTWTTAYDNQTTACFSIYEGERSMACANNLLGEFCLHGLRKAPAREIKFLVVFKIDRDGVLHVSATNKDNQDKGGITITADKRSLKEDEISRMIRDARKYEFEDMQRKKAAEEQERERTRFSRWKFAEYVMLE